MKFAYTDAQYHFETSWAQRAGNSYRGGGDFVLALNGVSNILLVLWSWESYIAVVFLHLTD